MVPSKIVLMPLKNETVRAHDHAIFCISLHSGKLVNLSFGLRPKLGILIKPWSQSLVSAKD